MPLRQLNEPNLARRSGHRPKLKPIVAGATTLALGVSGVFLAATPALAAPGASQAEARYLSGTLLERSLDDVAAVAGERAVAGEGTEQVVTESGDLDLSVLSDLIELQIADGVSVPLTGANAGAVTQYAQASQDGSSRAATGAVTDQGVIDLGAPSGAPEALTVDLSTLIGDDLAASVANASLTAGVTTATAEQTATGAPVGDYNIAGLQANLTSPVIAGLSSDLIDSGEALDQTVAGTLGADGSLASGLTGAVSTLGVADVDVSATTDLSAVVTEALQANTVLGADGPVQVDLTTGAIAVDIAALLEANGRDLNDLAPGEEILSTELVGFITADVDELVNGLLDEVQTTVSTALATTGLTIAATVGDDPEAPLLTLNLDGTLGEIADGTTVPTLTVADTEFDLTLVTAPISAAVAGVLGLQLNTEALDLDLAPLYPALDSVLTDLVSLRANVQATEAGTFTEIALRLEVLNAPVPTDEDTVSVSALDDALALNLAQASVGPNALPTDEPTDPTAPTVVGITPIFGPEAGGTEVTITGTDLTDIDTVTFGGVPATGLTVVSPTELTVLTPAGVGLVDVVISGPNGTATLQDGFTYVPAGGGTDEPGTVISFTPTTGPEAGGTSVTIIGTGFTGADSVTFGDTPGTNFTVVSDNEITVTSPAGAGSVEVTVVGAPNGDIVAPAPFVYVPATGGGIATTVTTVAPTTGPEAGGTSVVIRGSGFNAIDEVRFNGVAGTGLIVFSDSELVVVTPAGVGQVPITLVDNAPGGSGSVTAPVAFSYIPAAAVTNPPVVGSVTPNTGPTIGGTVVTINGDNFTEGDTVNFGGVPATGVTVVSPTEITATTPAGTAGAVDVTVTRSTGESGTLADGYTYTTLPAVINTAAGNNGTSYSNCTAANAAGQSNFQSVDRNLDRDGDGIACETDGSDTRAGGATERNLAFTGSEGAQGSALAGILMLLVGGAIVAFRRKFAA